MLCSLLILLPRLLTGALCVSPAHVNPLCDVSWSGLYSNQLISFNTTARPAIRTSSSSGQWAPAEKRPEHEADHTLLVCASYCLSAHDRCRASTDRMLPLPTCNICSLDVMPCVSALLGKGGQLRLKALRSFQTPTQRFKLQQQAPQR
jgi:hypothetical protein